MSEDVLFRCDVPVNVYPYPRMTAIIRNGRRIMTPARMRELAAFYNELGWSLKAAKVIPETPLNEPIHMTVRIWRAGRGDLDNLLKSISDGLSHQRVWIDDRIVRHIDAAIVARGKSVAPRLVVELRPFRGFD
jgi:Holliday junction resolvase RusA-like endonuclease